MDNITPKKRFSISALKGFPSRGEKPAFVVFRKMAKRRDYIEKATAMKLVSLHVESEGYTRARATNSIIHDVSMTFDLSGEMALERLRQRAVVVLKSDSDAINSDFRVIGRDLWNAMVLVGQEKKNAKQ